MNEKYVAIPNFVKVKPKRFVQIFEGKQIELIIELVFYWVSIDVSQNEPI